MKFNPLNQRNISTQIADDPSVRTKSTKPAYFELTFSKCASGPAGRFKVYIELNSGDSDLLLGNFTEEKSHAIVRRTGILDFLPRGLKSDWPRFGKILDCSFESLELETKPTYIHGHNVWIL
jgi:hypothetical protein